MAEPEEGKTLLSGLTLAGVEQLQPGNVLPDQTCVRGKASGVAGDESGFFLVHSPTNLKYNISASFKDFKGLSKLCKARWIAVDVSGAAVLKRVRKDKGITEVTLKVPGAIKVEQWTREKSFEPKTFRDQSKAVKPAVVVPRGAKSPSPTRNDWATESSPPPADLSRQSVKFAERKITDRPAYTTLPPAKRKAPSLAPAPPQTQTQERSSTPSLAAFKGVDMDLFDLAPPKKRKISSEKTVLARASDVAATVAGATVTQTLSAHIHASNGPPASAVPTGVSVAAVTQYTQIPIAPAQAQDATLPSAAKPPAANSPAAPAAVQPAKTVAAPVNGSSYATATINAAPASAAPKPAPAASTLAKAPLSAVNVVNGPQHASTSSTPGASSLSAAERLRQARQKVEARAVADRAEQKARREQEIEAAASDVETLRKPLRVGANVYTPLLDISHGPSDPHAKYNTIAVIVEVKPLKTGKPNGPFIILLADPTMHKGTGQGDDLSVSLFRVQDAFPQMQVGDVLLLQSCTRTVFEGRARLTGQRDRWSWAVLSKNGSGITQKEHMAALKEAEEKHMRHMLLWGLSQEFTSEQTPVDASKSEKKLRRLEEVKKESGYFGCCVKILHVNIFPSSGGPPAEVLVTDGTLMSTRPRYFTSFSHGLPRNAVIGISLWAVPSGKLAEVLQAGNFVKFPNLRSKDYEGELEVVLHDKVTEAQHGTYQAPPSQLSSEDAQVISSRIDALQKKVDETVVREPLVTKLDKIVGLQPVSRSTELSPFLYTIHQDQDLSSIKSIKENRTIPNRYRLQARVIEITRKVENTIVQFCKKCQRSYGYNKEYCSSCNDDERIRAEYRWALQLRLKQDDSEETLSALLGAEEAANCFLPLPRLAAVDPSAKSTKDARSKAALEAKAKLQGVLAEGKRPLPLIDFSVQTYMVGNQAVLQVFDMKVTPEK